MEITSILIFWLIFSFVIGIIAFNKGRNFLGYFVLSILISPLITLIIILLLGDSEKLRLEKFKEIAGIIYSYNQPIQKTINKNISTTCNKCGKAIDLTNKNLVFCPFCDKKLDNSFYEWSKRNTDKTFDDFLLEYIPKSSDKSTNNDNSTNNVNPTKWYFSLLIVLFIVLAIAILTNPNSIDHKDAFIKKVIENTEKKSGEKNLSTEENLKLTQFERNITSSNYIIFSITNISWYGESKNIGIGIFGKIYFSDKIKEITTSDLFN